MMNLRFGLIFLLPLLAACEQLGIENPAQQEARQEAEGKAIGGACRQAGRALEDCYQINPRASKSAIFNGWRDMDAYMRDNKIENVTPQFPMTPPGKKRAAAVEEAAKEAAAAEEAKAAEAKAAEAKAAEAKAAEGKPADGKGAEAKPAEKPAEPASEPPAKPKKGRAAKQS